VDEELVREGKRLYSKDWRSRNKDKVAQYNRSYKERNPETIKQAKNRYYEKLALRHRQQDSKEVKQNGD
jgi:hypothetical protein